MQRGKSVKIKEVIESLCKLLSELGVDSVPGTDTFRRAKFNKGDAVPDCRPGLEPPPAGMGRGAGKCRRGLTGQGVGPGGEREWEGGLRRLQWEQGKLRLLWRGLQVAQAERARLLHQVLSSTSGSLDTHTATGCTGRSKELERLQTDSQVLEIYLEWKQMEPLFWCWMVSVIDTELAEPSPPLHRGAVPMALKSVVVKEARCRGDSGRRGTDELSETLLTLQVQLKARWAELTGHASPSEDVMASSEKAKIEERVKLRLRGLTETYAAPRPVCGRYRLRPPEHPTHRPHRPAKHCPSPAGQPIDAQASRLIEELREEEAGLRQEVERLRRGQREELQELASRLEGVVLIPPLKR